MYICVWLSVFYFLLLNSVEAEDESMPTCDGIPCCPTTKIFAQPYKCLFMELADRKDECCLIQSRMYFRSPTLATWTKDLARFVINDLHAAELLSRDCPIGTTIIPDKRNYISCIPKHSDYARRYPPRQKAMKSLDTTGSALLCNTIKENSSSIYNRLFTCWLPDCLDRLEIPTGFKHCYPPILHKEEKLQYCKLYADLSASQIFTSNDYKTMDPSKCVLPPLCREGRQSIDDKKSMVPFVNGGVKPIYCERLCPKENNNGQDENGNCRRRPLCQNKGENRYQINIFLHCVELASEKESLSRKGPSGNKVARPICEEDGSVPTPYSSKNPLASLSCVTIPTCGEGLTYEEYNCHKTFFAKAALPAGIILGVLILIFIIVLLLCIRRKRMNRLENDEQGIEGGMPDPEVQAMAVKPADFTVIRKNSPTKQSADSGKSSKKGPKSGKGTPKNEDNSKSRKKNSTEQSEKSSKKSVKKEKKKTKENEDHSD